LMLLYVLAARITVIRELKAKIKSTIMTNMKLQDLLLWTKLDFFGMSFSP